MPRVGLVLVAVVSLLLLAAGACGGGEPSGGAADAGAADAAGSLPDASASGDASPDAGGDASAASGLVGLKTSAGALSPAFDPAARAYALVPSVVSLGVPFTVTPTVAAGGTVKVNGAPVASGAPSAPIALNLLTPTVIDVEVAAGGTVTHATITVPPEQEAYVKASDNRRTLQLGLALALSGDGGRMVVGAAANTDVCYVFSRSGSSWVEEARLTKTPEPGAIVNLRFGSAVALSGDGDTLAVGAPTEGSAATGIDGDPAHVSATADSGAVYIYRRTGGAWVQQAFVKPSNTHGFAQFGFSVALSGDGSVLAVGSNQESSAGVGVDGAQAPVSTFRGSGAIYVFRRVAGAWGQEAYLKQSSHVANERALLGHSVAISADGATIAGGAPFEGSDATGVDGSQAQVPGYAGTGAVYVFRRAGGAWSQDAYVKASNTRAGAAPRGELGASVALSADGATLAVGARTETSGATGVNGDQADASAPYAGAVYVFRRAGAWSQEAYVKASNTRYNSYFHAVSLSPDGSTLAVGAHGEWSASRGVNGDATDASSNFAGAVYLFGRSGSTWKQNAYLKASNNKAPGATGAYQFGSSVALSTTTLAVGAAFDSSGAKGVGGDPWDVSAPSAGAVHVFR